MRRFPGPGPVFAYEWLTSSRRWQPYAVRALFVSALLVALWLSWEAAVPYSLTINQAQALLAGRVYYAIVGTQLALVLLAAPAATAGSVCLDKARGTLAHVLVTDLSSTEVVLGKLAARLTPVLALIACTLPVVALCTLLGGIDPETLAGTYAVTASLAVLACSLALTLSVWARKTHEVLLATYLFLIAWMLGGPMVRRLLAVTWAIPVLEWVEAVDPIRRVFMPASGPGAESAGLYCLGCLLASAALVGVAVWRLRPVAAQEAGGRPSRRRKGRGWGSLELPLGAAWGVLTARLPGPTLDGNPVLWREWYRNRPSRWTRRLWGAYYTAVVLFSVMAVASLGTGPMRGHMALWVNGFGVATGMLLLSVGASTSLSEERVRGSLDVLMTTPLSTRAIVWGKWLGGLRGALPLVLLPTALAVAVTWGTRHWPAVPVLLLLLVAYGAFYTSLGLALATWVPRLGRAVAVCVGVDVGLTVGGFFLVVMLFRTIEGERMLAVSPFGGPAVLTAVAAGGGPSDRGRWAAEVSWTDLFAFYGWDLLAILVYGAAALVLFVAALATFDRCLGRASGVERPGAGLSTGSDGAPTREADEVEVEPVQVGREE